MMSINSKKDINGVKKLFLFFRTYGVTKTCEKILLFPCKAIRRLVYVCIRNVELRRNHLGCSKHKHLPEVIVSLTSYPARIDYVHKCIRTLLDQTEKPDRVILWLADSQFPNMKHDLPEDLLNLQKYGLEIRWCCDLKPHKKYFFVMQENPDSIIVTVDDDVLYPRNTIELLLKSYANNPNAVSCNRANRIKVIDNHIAPYMDWEIPSKMSGVASHSLLATGVGGVLYPPHILDDLLFSKDIINETCLLADDLWLKSIEVISNVRIVIATKAFYIAGIKFYDVDSLYKKNIHGGGNDRQFMDILTRLKQYHVEETIVKDCQNFG